MIRIAITGPESTGKSTLAEQLAIHFKCPWVPEYARDFLLRTNGNYTFEDLDAIALGQLEAWKKHHSEQLCIYDTEMLVMKIWSEFKYHQLSPFIANAFQTQKIDLYLLCKPDIEWEEDELREHPELRHELFELYFNELQHHNLPFVVIEGQKEERVNNAINAIFQRLKLK